jgi:hypothetical protein
LTSQRWFSSTWRSATEISDTVCSVMVLPLEVVWYRKSPCNVARALLLPELWL